MTTRPTTTPRSKPPARGRISFRPASPILADALSLLARTAAIGLGVLALLRGLGLAGMAPR